MLNKESYEFNEKIIGKINVGIEIKEGDYSLNIILTQVYDWYDEKINLTGRGNVKNGILNYEINNNLEKGLYTLVKIEDCNKTFSIGKETNENVIDAFKIMGKTENLLWLYIYLYKYKNKTISNFVEHFNREYFGEGIKGYFFYLRDAIGYLIRNKYNNALAVSNYLMNSVKSNNVLCMPPLCRAPIEYEKKEWDNLRFIYPGADLNKDRIDSMIKAFLMIKKIRPEVELHLTGVKNKISDLLEKNSLKINKSDNVFIYDWLSEEKYVELLSKMDFTIIIREKNQVTYANFPSKIPVLMAKGIIPVVSDVGDYTKYYLKNNYNSFVIDGASPEVFAREILRIVSLPEYQLELLHKNAWETAKNEFEIVNWKERFCQFIASVDNMK